MSHAIDVAFGVTVMIVALLASGHALVYKREPRSAALWVVLIWVLPALGPVLYVLLGINRVQRRAARLRRGVERYRAIAGHSAGEPGTHLAPLAHLVGRVTQRPLLEGNAIEALVDGTQAFPAMLQAIETARSSVVMASYIFDGEGIGARFVDALAAAARRGVGVRVLIDDVDARFSWSSAVKPLRRAGVPVAVFNPPLVPARLHAINLRNHRKILVVDGDVGFTGGMNVDCRYWPPDRAGEAPFRDLHFRLRGPVVSQLAEVFADDWQFATGEALRGEQWFPRSRAEGGALARPIEDGPDQRPHRLRWAILGGLNAAQRSVRIMTPYFLPDSGLVSALGAAALRGVEVDILLPEKSDLPHVQWAVNAQLWQVLERGCRVRKSGGAFDHSKLMVVDGAWTLLGSANWDARSLRLNFELNCEVYSIEFGAYMEGLVQARFGAAREVTLAEMDARSMPVKIRDGIARLFSPFL
ncbi:MAG TPA: phospholipase D-like domain-containing protein [Burkholderiales bacterium]|nr:phospholipase D-like domain-containing protein [Burkholderiales bacterium]